MHEKFRKFIIKYYLYLLVISVFLGLQKINTKQ